MNKNEDMNNRVHVHFAPLLRSRMQDTQITRRQELEVPNECLKISLSRSKTGEENVANGSNSRKAGIRLSPKIL